MDAHTFKSVMAQFPSGVTVITSKLDGEWHGMTASSCSSVSLEPPMISVCIANKLPTHRFIRESGVLAVNVLNAEQIELGKLFAGFYNARVHDRFAGLDCMTAVTGAPILPNVVAWLDCRVRHAYDGGDHTIFVAEAVAGNIAHHFVPMVYHNRRWGQFAVYPPLRVEIVEVGPRDGWQSEKQLIPTSIKVEMIHALVDAGVQRIQVTSFVHPKLVPQMADAEDVCVRIVRKPDVTYSALALNLKGVERAHKAGITHIDIGVSASETHSRKNANRSVNEALTDFKRMVERARAYGMTVRGGIQCAFGCVYEGVIDPQRVLEIAKHHLALGVDELSIADSTGMANPAQMRRMMQQLVPLAAGKPVVLHLHDTRGMGLANLLAALECGVTQFDTAFGGLGGCPFIEGATGNIATEDTVHMLHEMGVHTGIDIERVAQVSRQMETLLGKPLLGKVYKLMSGEKEKQVVAGD
jgi:hydroxymethylglutaryl-CoA lyase